MTQHVRSKMMLTVRRALAILYVKRYVKIEAVIFHVKTCLLLDLRSLLTQSGTSKTGKMRSYVPKMFFWIGIRA